MSILPTAKTIYYLSPNGSRVKALPTGQLFHNSNSRWRLVMGPVGSGKSLMMCQEIFRRASRQAPNKDGIRRSRWAVIRNSYPMLRDTTMNTWLDWFPEAKFGKAKHAPPPEHALSWEVEDPTGGVTRVECELLFRALDSTDQVRNLLSLELTGAWVNEAREIPAPILDVLDTRIGRFPSMQDGGCTWKGVFMDTNPYDTDHELYSRFEAQRLPGYEFWTQPGEENSANLPANYYEDISIGKDPEWVRIYVKGQHGFILEGKRVYDEFYHDAHVSREPLSFNPNLPIFVGLDFGLTPAAIWTQLAPNGRWIILRELLSTSMGIDRFGDLVLEAQNIHFPGAQEFRYFADPAGTGRAQTDEKTCFQILSTKGIDCEPGAVDFAARREAVGRRLGMMIDGHPAVLIDGLNCRTLVKGFMGGYHFPEIGNTGRHSEKPLKDQFSHPHDALQYIATCIFSARQKKKKTARKRPNWVTV